MRGLSNGFGLFEKNTDLPAEYSKVLFEISEACRTEEFLSNFETDNKLTELEKWRDLNSYIEENEIELSDTQAAAHSAICIYVLKNTFAGNQSELYAELLEKSCYNTMCTPNVKAAEAQLMEYLPAAYDKKLPTRGGWILVAKPVTVEEKFRPVVYGIYFAKGYWKPDPRAQAIAKDYKIKLANAGSRYMIRINTGLSDVSLYPHEYILIKDIKEVFAELGKSYEMVKLGGTPNVEEERVHYLLSRGISREKIYEKLLSTVNTVNYCMFHPTQKTIEDLDEIVNTRFKSPFIDYVAPSITVKI